MIYATTNTQREQSRQIWVRSFTLDGSLSSHPHWVNAFLPTGHLLVPQLTRSCGKKWEHMLGPLGGLGYYDPTYGPEHKMGHTVLDLFFENASQFDVSDWKKLVKRMQSHPPSQPPPNAPFWIEQIELKVMQKEQHQDLWRNIQPTHDDKDQGRARRI